MNEDNEDDPSALEERFEEAASLTDTGPASLVRAEVAVGGEERTVTDYFELVYSASRHNTLVDYWVILKPPVVLEGVAKAWHIHKLQVDWLYVASGALKIALYDTRPDSPTHSELMEILMGDIYPAKVVKIPPGVAHGYKI